MASLANFVEKELESARRETRMLQRHLSSGDCERAVQSIRTATLFSGSAMRTAIRIASQDKSAEARDLKIETYAQDQELDSLTGQFVMACVRR